ncbi:MAG: metallophosphoesterase [Planctomycetes bacterium]|nr:metallophosphoesterase [Planctomycetota bacterium]
MRRVYVGDVHGCLSELDALLERVEFRAGTDRLCSVGDLVNKGPDSHGVLRRMIDLGAIAVRGNHDLLWLDRGLIEDPTLEAWLRAQPIVRVEPDVIVVHAALHPHWTIEDLEAGIERPEQIDFAVNVRYCTADGRRPPSDWPPPEPPFVPWDEHYRGDRTVVFGHWARRGFDRTERTVALDSACVYGGKLTAWIADEDRAVQVDSQRG